MLIRIGFEIEFELQGPTPMVLMLFVRPSRQPDLRAPEELVIEPPLTATYYIDLFGNRCARIFAQAGKVLLKLDTLIEDSGRPDRDPANAPQIPVQDLPNETLAFLLASRYCEVDKLSDIAWKLFGHTEPG